ncbi:MAG TPA: IS5 family transposase [Opitutus sp.]|nr:IS5 family transposase [Opitutus sp.]
MEIGGLFNVEDRIAPLHPIRTIKRQCDAALAAMSEHFDEIYAGSGRPSIPPERLLKAKVLMALHSVRSDRMFCERLNYDLLFQWFLDMNPSEAAFDASTFSQNQARLLQHEVADLFFHEVVELARAHHWVSNEHFTVDGTLIEAWASMKSFQPKRGPRSGPRAGNPWSEFAGQPRKNDTHQRTTDPEAKLVRKSDGDKARLCFGAHVVMENRSGLCVLLAVRNAVGEPESAVAVDSVLELRNRGFTPKTVGADRGYHTETFIEELRAEQIEAHPALMDSRHPRGVQRHRRWRASQKVRKRIEEIFGWMKTTGSFRKSRYRGVARTHAAAQYVAAACNLVRMAKLMLTAPPALAGA